MERLRSPRALKKKAKRRVDPVTVELVRNGLIAAT